VAKTYYERALKLDPNDPLALNNLAYCCGNNGDLNEALSYAQRAKQRSPLSVKSPTRSVDLYEEEPDDTPSITSRRWWFSREQPDLPLPLRYGAESEGDRESARKECQRRSTTGE